MTTTEEVVEDESSAKPNSGGSLAEERSREREERIAARIARDTERLEAAEAAGCEPCKHAVLEGWWGPLPGGCRTHCSTCHRSWSSLREAHCTLCCRHFVSHKVADRHWGPDGCMDPATMLKRDGRPWFQARERPGGVTWALAFYGERPAHWGVPAGTTPTS
jgi:hypothetical protein